MNQFEVSCNVFCNCFRCGKPFARQYTIRHHLKNCSKLQEMNAVKTNGKTIIPVTEAPTDWWNIRCDTGPNCDFQNVNYSCKFLAYNTLFF